MARTSYFTGFPLNQNQSVYVEDVIRQLGDLYTDTEEILNTTIDARDQAQASAQSATSSENIAVAARDDALVAKQEAQDAAYDAEQERLQAQQAAADAEGSSQAAATYASTATDVLDQVTNLYGDATEIQDAVTTAVDAKDEAVQARDATLYALDNAEEIYGDTAALQLAVTQAEDAQTLAEKWASEAEDVPVVPGQFSAKHWAAKASEELGQSALKNQNLSDLTDLKAARSNLGTFSSVADVQNSHIPPVLDSIRTNGYYSPGDGGGALYKRVASEPSHEGKIQSADGAWWELASLDRLNVLMFGAVPGQDCTAAFQAASDYAELHGGVVVVPTPNSGQLYGISGLYIRPGVTLTGDQEGVFKTFSPASFDLGNETSIRACLKAIGPVGTPMLYIARQGCVQNLTLVDLRQDLNIQTLDQPPEPTQIAIQLGYPGSGNQTGQRISNIAFLGFNQFLSQYLPDDPEENIPNVGALTLEKIYGMPFDVGVNIAIMKDTSRAYDCQFIPNSFVSLLPGSADRQLVVRTLARRVTAWKVGEADGFQLFGCQALAVRYFWHSYRDAYPGDQNTGGGFNIVSCPIDVCVVGYRFDRNAQNPIGSSITGGQIIPIVARDDEENVAFQFNTPAGASGFHLSVTGASIHTGGGVPTDSNIRDSGITGPNSARNPEYVVDLSNAHNVNIKFVNCRLRSVKDVPFIIEHASRNGNNVSILNCEGRARTPLNIIPSRKGGDDADVFTLYNTGNPTPLKLVNEDGAYFEISLEPTGRVRLNSGSDIRLVSKDEFGVEQSLLWGATGTLEAAGSTEASLGTGSNRYKEIYSDAYFIGSPNRGIFSGSGSPEGVVSAPQGSLYLNEDGGDSTTLWVKASGGQAVNTGWRAVPT